MIRGYVICEGQTEETFIRDVIAPILAYQSIYLTARLIPTSKNNKGGALTYSARPTVAVAPSENRYTYFQGGMRSFRAVKTKE